MKNFKLLNLIFVFIVINYCNLRSNAAESSLTEVSSKICRDYNNNVRHHPNFHFEFIQLFLNLLENNNISEIYQYLIEYNLLKPNLRIEQRIVNGSKFDQKFFNFIIFKNLNSEILYLFKLYKQEIKHTQNLTNYIKLFRYCQKYSKLHKWSGLKYYDIFLIKSIILKKIYSLYKFDNELAINFFNSTQNYKYKFLKKGKNEAY